MYVKLVIVLIWLLLTWTKKISWRVSAVLAIAGWIFLILYSQVSNPSATIQYQVSLVAYVAMIMAVIGRFRYEPSA